MPTLLGVNRKRIPRYRIENKQLEVDYQMEDDLFLDARSDSRI